jgi:hypothetical protein
MTLPRQDQVRFIPGAPLEDDSPYVVVNKDGTSTGDAAEPLGKGGAGIVYRAHYKLLMQRAIKFLAPRDDLRDSDATAQFERTFDAEISILAR